MDEGRLEDDNGEEKDMLVYPYLEGGWFWVGPLFGCVHFKKKEK
jgi:hypothetical protein